MASCGKTFLDVRPDAAIVTPDKLSDYRAILDHGVGFFNSYSSHELGVIGSDEYILNAEIWGGLNQPYFKNAYLWRQDVYEGGPSLDWNRAYERILIANMVIEGLDNIDKEQRHLSEWDELKGEALFHRGYNYYQLVQLFCEAYDSERAVNQLGLPLRREFDFSIKTPRSNLLETYDFIMEDLLNAAELLPDQAILKMRPSKWAANALLAKVHINLGNYELAVFFSDLVLDQSDDLIDFNSIDSDKVSIDNLPFPTQGLDNKEVIFINSLSYINNVHITNYFINPDYLELYDQGDLRKEIYFVDYLGRKIFVGSYVGSIAPFTGLAIDEILLIKSESLIRLNRIEEGVSFLNKLRESRFDVSRYEPISVQSQSQAIRIIIDERKRELFFRGTRWEDLKRFNKETEFATSLDREMEGELHRLEPFSDRWVWPLPDNAIDLGKYEQNP